MSPYLPALFALLSFFWAHIAQAQKSLAVCTDEYEWAFNSQGQSPCDMAAQLMGICWGTNYTVYALTSGGSYWGPWSGFDSVCVCSTVTWCLFAACGICQEETAIPWSTWAYNCTNVTISSFPLTIPQQADIPHWPYLGVGGDGRWDEAAAQADAENLSPHSHHTPVGAIVGGVIGGLVALAIAITVFVVIRHRSRLEATKKPPSIIYGPEGPSPYMPGDVTVQPAAAPGFSPDYSMHQRLYDPSDPSTFPPDRSSAAYTTPSESPARHRTVIY